MAEGGISGQFYLSLKINDQEIPGLRDCISQILVVNSVLGVPCAQITFNDNQDAFSGPFALVDGTRITISRGKTRDVMRTSTFIVVGQRDRALKVVTCLLDVPGFFTDTKAMAQRGTSLDVAKKIAGDYGLQFETNVSGVDDNMRWTTFGQSPRLFLETLEQRMWIPDGGYPQVVVTEDKRLKLIDVIKAMQEEPKTVFSYNYPVENGSAVLVEEISAKSISGFLNMNVGYGSTLMATNGDGEVERFSKGKIKAGGSPNVNAKQREAITGTNYTFQPHQPISKGASANVHKHWVEALDNWRRNYAAFSEFCRVRFNGSLKDLELLTPVQLYAGSVTAKGAVLNEKQSGKWLYAGYTELIRRRSYHTAALLTRNFVGTKGTTELVDGDNGKNKASNRQPSVADTVRPPQQNDGVRQLGNGLNAIDQVVEKQTQQLDALMGKMVETASSAINLPELAAKYGPESDLLDALMSEFSMAAFTNRLCGMLSPLEKLSLDFGIKNPATIFQLLDSRLGEMEALMGQFEGDINDMIARGDIPEGYRNVPTLNAPCADNKVSEMNDAIADKLGSKCLDAFSLDKLHGPSFDLASLYQKMEEYLRKFQCAFGGQNSADVEIV